MRGGVRGCGGKGGLESEEQGGAWCSHLDKEREACSAQRDLVSRGPGPWSLEGRATQTW